jgi:hypothetical protein
MDFGGIIHGWTMEMTNRKTLGTSGGRRICFHGVRLLFRTQDWACNYEDRFGRIRADNGVFFYPFDLKRGRKADFPNLLPIIFKFFLEPNHTNDH